MELQDPSKPCTRWRSYLIFDPKRRELAFDYQTALEAGLTGQQDPGVLAIAAGEGRVLLTHDVRTITQHFASFIGAHTSAGVLLVP